MKHTAIMVAPFRTGCGFASQESETMQIFSIFACKGELYLLIGKSFIPRATTTSPCVVPIVANRASGPGSALTAQSASGENLQSACEEKWALRVSYEEAHICLR